VALFCCCLKPGDVRAADIQSLLLQASSGTKQPKKQQQQQQQHKPKPKPTSSVSECTVHCTPIEWGEEVEEVWYNAPTQLNSTQLNSSQLNSTAARLPSPCCAGGRLQE
jgi:hypothetical protein